MGAILMLRLSHTIPSGRGMMLQQALSLAAPFNSVQSRYAPTASQQRGLCAVASAAVRGGQEVRHIPPEQALMHAHVWPVCQFVWHWVLPHLHTCLLKG